MTDMTAAMEAARRIEERDEIGIEPRHMKDARIVARALLAHQDERLRSVNAALVEALELAERAYQIGIVNDKEDLWDRAVGARRAALKLAKGP